MTNIGTRFPWLHVSGCIAALSLTAPLGIGGCGPQYSPCGDDPSALSDDDDTGSADDDDWPWEKKNQFRQEELLHEVYTLFADNSNWTLQLMYELHDTGGTTVDKTVAWLDHAAAYCDHLDADRLRLYCGICTSVDDMFATGHFDVLSGEGVTVTPAFPQQVHEASWYLDLPIIYRGFDPLDEDGVRMDNQDDIPDDYANDIGWDHNLEVMREFILWGIGPSPFFHYTEWDTHDHLDGYALELADFLETVETWHDEPGDEIREDTVPGNPLW